LNRLRGLLLCVSSSLFIWHAEQQHLLVCAGLVHGENKREGIALPIPRLEMVFATLNVTVTVFLRREVAVVVGQEVSGHNKDGLLVL